MLLLSRALSYTRGKDQKQSYFQDTEMRSDMDKITLDAYAKINLFLEVCEKRPDNYHNIDSIMHTVSLKDVITVEKCDTIILSNNAGLPNDTGNLAYRAAKAFFDHAKIQGGASIHIEKNIPISAGLAGGSTDAAAVLKGLNAIYNTELSEDTLCEIGSKLGADVPFCIKGGCFVTQGIGDEFAECTPLPDCFIVVSKCGEGVSTPYAYGQIDSMRENNFDHLNTSAKMVYALKTNDLKAVSENIFNVFENVVCPIRPKVNEQKIIMDQNGAVCSMMSGSGPSVFGIFNTKKQAEKALSALIEYGADAHLCKPIK